MTTRKLPFRPSNEISQPFSDGSVTIYRVPETFQPGYLAQPRAEKLGFARYAEQRMGILRYNAARENGIQVERVIRIPAGIHVLPKDAVVTENGRTYVVDMVQKVIGVYPPCLDLTLAADAVSGVREVITLFGPADGDTMPATIFRGVYLDILTGSTTSTTGLNNGDSATVLIPLGTPGEDALSGETRTYLPAHLYKREADKSKYWTIDPSANLVGSFWVRGELHETGKYQTINAEYGEVYRVQSVKEKRVGAMAELYLEVKAK